MELWRGSKVGGSGLKSFLDDILLCASGDAADVTAATAVTDEAPTIDDGVAGEGLTGAGLDD